MSLHNEMVKKVPKVAVLRSICSDLGQDSVYSNEMHSGISRFLSVSIPKCKRKKHRGTFYNLISNLHTVGNPSRAINPKS